MPTLNPVLAMLKTDHKTVQALFDEYQEASPQKQPTIAQTAIEELKIHAELEEGLIYPAIRKGIEDDELMNEANEEHHLVHVLIAELEHLRPTDDSFKAKFNVLAEIVKHHVKEEEGEMCRGDPQRMDFDWLDGRLTLIPHVTVGDGERHSDRHHLSHSILPGDRLLLNCFFFRRMHDGIDLLARCGELRVLHLQLDIEFASQEREEPHVCLEVWDHGQRWIRICSEPDGDVLHIDGESQRLHMERANCDLKIRESLAGLLFCILFHGCAEHRRRDQNRDDQQANDCSSNDPVTMRP
jgi:hypothetical protein